MTLKSYIKSSAPQGDANDVLAEARQRAQASKNTETSDQSLNATDIKICNCCRQKLVDAGFIQLRNE